MNKNRFFRAAALAAAVFLSIPHGAKAQTPIFTETGAWDYLHPTDGANPALTDGDFGSTWFLMDGSYNGPAFTANKPGPFSYGGITYWGNTGTFIGVGGTSTAPASGQRYTAYFKRQFTAATDLTDVNLVMLVDDGAVIYIDGVERKRINMTGTVVGRENNGTGDDYPMLADGAKDESLLLPPVSLGAISAGTHTIAISLHNSATDSSDLGLWVQMYGSAPPTPILKTIFGGVATDVTVVPGFTGWAAPRPFSFSMNGPGGIHTLESQPVDLQTIGQAYFSMQMYCYEGSTGSNFEATDEFSATLLLTLDDDTQTQVNLVPDSLDLDLNGKINGDDFNVGLLPVTASIVVGRQLNAVIPANAKTAVLRVTGSNDSPTEFFTFGGAVISDVPLDTDEDGDGVNRAAELFSGTNPADKTSVLRADSVKIDLDIPNNQQAFYLTFPSVAGKHYAVERSADGGASWEFVGTVTPTGTGAFTVYVDLGATPAPRYFERLVCVP
jgi:hypothetical protein